MKIALVYDRVNKIGGAERVLQALHEIWPEAPLYTAVYNPETAPWAKDFRVIPSFLQKFPFAKTSHELYPWLTPLAFESFDFSDYEIVISVTSAEAKGIITRPGTLHLCYCLTPTRYLWSGTWDYPLPFFLRPLIGRLRLWDQVACQRPDVYVAISKTVSQRIKKYYRREAEIIYPPIDIEKFVPNHQPASPVGGSSIISKACRSAINHQLYFLIVSRLVPYKKIDLAIEAFNKLGLPLEIIGIGSEMGKLKQMAKDNIQFLGQLTDEEVLGYYQRCRVVIFPGIEDFGLVPLEAAACGKPVIAYREGGALETIVEGKTGEFFYPQTAAALEEKILRYKDIKILREKYKPKDCRAQAEKFGINIFKEKFKDFVEREWKNYSQNISTS